MAQITCGDKVYLLSKEVFLEKGEIHEVVEGSLSEIHKHV